MEDVLNLNLTEQEVMESLLQHERNNVILRTAIDRGTQAGFDRLQIFERLVNFLLDLNDDVMQEQLTKIMEAPTPPNLVIPSNNLTDV